MPVDSNGAASTKLNGKSEIRLHAKAVSRGIAIGRVVCLHGALRQFFRVALSENKIGPEIDRLRRAFKVASQRLRRLANSDASRTLNSSQSIFEAHRLILEDAALLAKIEEVVRRQHVNAEWAVKTVTDDYVAKFRAIPDEHFRDRLLDLEDVVERIQSALGGEPGPNIHLDNKSIIAAKELRPSTVIELHRQNPAALITEHGGWTSHTFILAREVNIPAVTGLQKILRRLNTGDQVIVDGFRGDVVIHPTPETLDAYRAARSKISVIGPAESDRPPRSPKTLDGREITLRVNADLPDIYDRARSLGAKGIGLFRSEFLFNRFSGYPTEYQQIVAYRRLAAACAPDGVKIRTFDIGVGQLIDRSDDKERNPALGLRGIRLGMSYPDQLRIQLRAILRAAKDRMIDIVIPMISDPSEVRHVRSIMGNETARLKEEGIPHGAPKLGAMIEVPAAVFTADEIAAESDFLSLGTNDLIQYLLAVDRDNENVSGWFRTLHPSVLRAIKHVIDSSERIGKPLIICGEMAGSPYYVPVLIGLGATDLSMTVNSLGRVRRVIEGIDYAEARTFADELLSSGTAETTESLVKDRNTANWTHLFDDGPAVQK